MNNSGMEKLDKIIDYKHWIHLNAELILTVQIMVIEVNVNVMYPDKIKIVYKT